MATEYTGRDRDITVRVGEELVIGLESNPTTGYEWEAHFDSSMLQVVDRQFSAHGAGIGSGGIERFRLKPLTAGETTRDQDKIEGGNFAALDLTGKRARMLTAYSN